MNTQHIPPCGKERSDVDTPLGGWRKSVSVRIHFFQKQSQHTLLQPPPPPPPPPLHTHTSGADLLPDLASAPTSLRTPFSFPLSSPQEKSQHTPPSGGALQVGTHHHGNQPGHVVREGRIVCGLIGTTSGVVNLPLLFQPLEHHFPEANTSGVRPATIILTQDKSTRVHLSNGHATISTQP